MRAAVVNNNLESLIVQNVVLIASIADAYLKLVFLEDCFAVNGEAGHLFVSILNLSRNHQCVREGTGMGTVVPVALVYRAIPQQLSDAAEAKTEVVNDHLYILFVKFTKLQN